MEKKHKKEFVKAGTLISAGAGVGQTIGGSIGIAAFGGAVGVPLFIVGGAVGLLGYGAYKMGEAYFKDDSENKKNTTF